MFLRYIAILPIHNNTYKLKTNQYNKISHVQLVEASMKYNKKYQFPRVPLDTLLLRYYIKVLFCLGG